MNWNGERLKSARNSAKVTQQQLADKMNVDKRTILNYEMNRQSPTINFLLEAAKFLNVSYKWLLLGIGSLTGDEKIDEDSILEKKDLERIILYWDNKEIRDTGINLIREKLLHYDLINKLEQERRKENKN